MSRHKTEYVSWKTHQQSMFKIVKTYMEELNPGKRVEIVPKLSGDQLGCTARIFLEENKHISYYVKTFSNGTSDKGNYWTVSYDAKPDLKELFVYKALEYMGFGPKCQFISAISSIDPNKKEYYLVTQDLAYTKDPTKNKMYSLFNQANFYHKFNPLINLLCLDLLIKTFHLNDIHNENYGQMLINEEKEKWHIHDFNITVKKVNVGSGEDILNIRDRNVVIRAGTYPCLSSYMSQKGYRELNPCDLISFINHAMNILNEGRKSINGNKCGFEEALSTAFVDIMNFIQDDDNYSMDDIDELGNYYDGVLTNFNVARDLLQNEPEELVDNKIVPYRPL